MNRGSEGLISGGVVEAGDRSGTTGKPVSRAGSEVRRKHGQDCA